MEQKFTKLEDGRIKWTYNSGEEEFSDKDFGALGKTIRMQEIIFDDKEKAMTVLDRDITEVEASIDKYKQDMDKNAHDLDKFTDLKELVESVGKLHNDFKEKEQDSKIFNLYKDDPKRYQKLWSEFNKAKDYIKDEMSAINSEYQKYLEYKNSKKAYDFNVAQLEKIKEQKEELLKL
jgi:hypothetical protein